MSTSTILIIVLCALLISIFLGWKFGINTGLVALCFSYIIGTFILGTKPSVLIGYFPTKILFLLFSINWFYGFATSNGTMKALSEHLMYAFRKTPKLLPFVAWLICAIIGGLGTGAPIVTAIMSPILLPIVETTGFPVLCAVCAIQIGCLAGTLAPWSGAGNIVKGVLLGIEGLAGDASSIVNSLWLSMLTWSLVAMIITYFIFGGYKTKAAEMKEPTPYTDVQKKNLILIGCYVFLVIVPNMINKFFPNPACAWLASKIDLQFVALLGAAAATLMNLGDSREIITRRIPWATILMVCGIGVLMEIAGKAGATDMIGTWMGNNVSAALVPAVFVLLAGFMSTFSSALSVVTPMLCPMVPALVATTGIPAAVMVSAIVIAANATGLSPFSQGGSMMLSFAKNEEEQAILFRKQFGYMFFVWALALIFALIGVFKIFA